MDKFRNRAATAAAAAISILGASIAQAEPVRYEVEPHHTFVNFEVKHFNTSTVRARFDTVAGYVVLDRKSGTGQADISIDAGSISSGIPDFDKHLKSADFLNVAQWPKARFVGREFRYDGDKLKSMAGDLSLLGKTAPVTLTASNFNCYDSPVLKAHVCGGDFETTIQRSLWGMNWGIDIGVPDAVRLLVQIEAIQK
ncbi:YceI family protein [Pollutimonas bauzanensis]|uniref:Polyisoprenoid-binding protein YceI n=1 Tax=Pollutimonas bauzanensis TaxID=658167 RepID=A0A1M5SSP5_9BURK|nr:YceI family protein [Pollutimonas bauzanensis]SHH40963.1 Polyisoprenoid-binding protein YceI [Pollutimonas bauzanensis]